MTMTDVRTRVKIFLKKSMDWGKFSVFFFKLHFEKISGNPGQTFLIASMDHSVKKGTNFCTFFQAYLLNARLERLQSKPMSE